MIKKRHAFGAAAAILTTAAVSAPAWPPDAGPRGNPATQAGDEGAEAPSAEEEVRLAAVP